MAEVTAFPATRAGDRLRQAVAARRLRLGRFRLFALGGFAVSALASTVLWPVPRLLVWNASASAPMGLYRVHPRAPVRRGDMVVAWAPPWARSLAAARLYLPTGVPLVKRVAAAAGDRVCAAGRTIQIDSRPAGTRLGRDPAGRPMPWWSGCRTLARGEYFLLTESPLSFDGRYFGISSADDILGPARLLWAKPGRKNG